MRVSQNGLKVNVTKHLTLLLFIGLAWGQGTDSLIVDKSFYDNGKLKYQRFYKDGKANGKWTHYYDDGNIWIEGNYYNGIQVGLWAIIKTMREVENGYSIMMMEQFMKKKSTNLRCYLNILSAPHSWGFLFVG